jgi:hypothetical protein
MANRLQSIEGLKALKGSAFPALLVLVAIVVQPCAAVAANSLFTDSRFTNGFTGNVKAVEVYTAQSPATTTTLLQGSTSITSTMVTAYQANLANLKALLQSQMNTILTSSGSGFQGSPTINLDSSPKTSGFSDPRTGQIGIMLTLDNNSVDAELTTSSILGSWANPKVTVTFSAQVAVLLTLQNNQFVMSQATARTFNANVKADNAPAAIGKALMNFGIIETPDLNQVAAIPASVQAPLNAATAAVNTALKSLGGASSLVAPTTAINIQVTIASCQGAGLTSVASPCTCSPGSNLNTECDTYGTAMCLSVVQLNKVPKCTGTTYLSCSNLPPIASRDRTGNWLSKVTLNCMKIPVAGNTPSKSGPPPKGTGLPMSNPANTPNAPNH